MAFFPVSHYQVDWLSTTNTFRIAILLQPGGQPITLQVNTESEYIALTYMLGRPGVLFDTTTGDLQLPLRLAGT